MNFIWNLSKFRKLLFAFCATRASPERWPDSRDSRRLKNRRPTGGLSSIPHRREMPVTINAGKCVPSPQEAPIRYAIMPGGAQGAMMANAGSNPIVAKGARLMRRISAFL